MKLKIKELSERIRLRMEKRMNWHRWFAWKPVRVGAEDVRWLEMVERRAEYVSPVYEPDYVIWHYRTPH